MTCYQNALRVSTETLNSAQAVIMHCLCQTMLEDKLRETDWELTQDTIEEQVARESYLQWLKDQEKYGKMSKTSVS